MLVYIKKLFNIPMWILDKLSRNTYKKVYPKYLKWLGIVIDDSEPENTWVNPTCFMDSTRYDFIKIGKRVTLSFDVAILVHDYSVVHAAYAGGGKVKSIICKRVEIGDNVFVGAKSIILPGTKIGNNTIIGAGSVIKGNVEENSVYCGNPARKLCSIEHFMSKHQDLLT